MSVSEKDAPYSKKYLNSDFRLPHRVGKLWSKVNDGVKTKVKENVMGKLNVFKGLTAAEIGTIPIDCVNQAKVKK